MLYKLKLNKKKKKCKEKNKKIKKCKKKNIEIVI